MSGTQTNGFDLVLELSGAQIQETLGALVIPPTVGLPLPNTTFTLSASRRYFPRPGADIQAGGGVNLTVGYRSVIIGGVPIGGVQVSVAAQIADDGGNPRRIQVTFPSAPIITLDDPAALDTLLRLAGGAVTRAQALAIAQQALWTFLQGASSMPPIPMGQSLGSGPCAPTLSDLRVRTVPGALLLLIAVAGSGIVRPSPPNPGAFQRTTLNGRNAVLTLSNNALLGLTTCVASQPGSPLAGAAWAVSGAAGECRRITAPIRFTVKGHSVSLDSLQICVVGNEVVVSGSVSHSGDGYRVSGTFAAPFSFACAPGGVALAFDPDRVESDVDTEFEAWVYLAAIFGGPAVFAIAGPVLGPLLPAMVSFATVVASPIGDLILSSIAKTALGSFGTSAVGRANTQLSLLPPQLARWVGTIQCSAVVLDDLELSGELSGERPSTSLHSSQEVTNREEMWRIEELWYSQVTYWVARRITVTASTAGMREPNSYTWTLAGEEVRGSGTVRVMGRSQLSAVSELDVQFQVADNSLEISPPLGADLQLPVAVRVEDSEGMALSLSTVVSAVGSSTARVPTDESSFGELWDTLAETTWVGERLGALRFDPVDAWIARQLMAHRLYPGEYEPPSEVGPVGPDPPPHLDFHRDLPIELTQALAVGMGVDPQVLAKSAGVEIGPDRP